MKSFVLSLSLLVIPLSVNADIASHLGWPAPVPAIDETGGGQDLGGGNADGNNRVEEHELSSLGSRYESHRGELFRALRLTGLISQRLLDVQPSLSRPLPAAEIEVHRRNVRLAAVIFRDAATFDQRLSSIRVEYRRNGPCLDRAGNPVDGSVIAKFPDAVCISTHRLSRRLNRANAEIELLALYMHEVSHLFGTNEEEATQLQNSIRELGSNFHKYLSFVFQDRSPFVISMIGISDLIDGLNLKTDPDAVLCKTLPEISRRLTQALIEGNLNTLQVLELRFQAIPEFHAAVILAGFSADFCTADMDLAKQMRWLKFRDQDVRPVAFMYPDPLMFLPPFDPDQVKKYSQYLLADLTSHEISKVRQGDRTALARNLSGLKAAFESMVPAVVREIFRDQARRDAERRP